VTDDEFKWDLLGDLAFEDLYMLWEPLGWARTCFPGRADTDRQSLVERTLNALYDDGLVYFVRAGAGEDENTVADDPGRHLAVDEIRRLIAGGDWRTTPLGADATKVWVGATEAGKAAAEAPPPEIRAYWGRR
jgi:hypothetical protein